MSELFVRLRLWLTSPHQPWIWFKQSGGIRRNCWTWSGSTLIAGRFCSDANDEGWRRDGKTMAVWHAWSDTNAIRHNARTQHSTWKLGLLPAQLKGVAEQAVWLAEQCGESHPGEEAERPRAVSTSRLAWILLYFRHSLLHVWGFKHQLQVSLSALFLIFTSLIKTGSVNPPTIFCSSGSYPSSHLAATHTPLTRTHLALNLLVRLTTPARCPRLQEPSFVSLIVVKSQTLSSTCCRATINYHPAATIVRQQRGEAAFAF